MIEQFEGIKVGESASAIIRQVKPTERSPRGRPTKFTKDLIKDAELLASNGLSERDIYSYWGISERTYYYWKTKNEKLCQAVRRGRLIADIKAVQQLWNLCMKGDVKALTFWLANRRPEYWGRKA